MWNRCVRGHGAGVVDDVGSRWFLVELNVAGPGGDQAEGMSRALRLAVRRLQAAGSTAQWLGAVEVHSTGSALCFLAAADATDVVRACETAGLPQAPVLEVADLQPGALPHRAFPPAPHRR